jgi:3-hydroxyacyl-[acyl-carrier protein] dehydratase/trans-2-decenoyl-[acyl-carrier protein] isomerase
MSLAQHHTFNHDELLACGRGELFGPGNAQLPLPDMLMFDRITEIRAGAGEYGQGLLVAELDIHPDLWFFKCHFMNDPVMPGCLGLDAMWQLVGFYLGWTGAPGRGRALGAGEIRFSGQVTPGNKLVTYTIDMKRVIKRKLAMGVGDGRMAVDGKQIYLARDLRVGLFRDGTGAGFQE